MKPRFLKLFASLPIPERENTIYVHPKYGAMSWLVANLEVRADTEIGKDILEFLDRAKII